MADLYEILGTRVADWRTAGYPSFGRDDRDIRREDVLAVSVGAPPVTGKDETSVPISAAKGRPMLSWVGKGPLREVRSFPAQLAERFAPPTPADDVSDAVDWSDWPAQFDRGGLLFHGDNKEVLAHLLANGFRAKVDPGR